MLRKAAALLIATGLAACSDHHGFAGSAGDPPYFCDIGSVGTSTIDDGCVGCSVQQPELATDDDPRSAATIHVLTSIEEMGASIWEDSPLYFLLPFPAGSEAGAFITMPDNAGGVLASLAIRIRTYNLGFQSEAAEYGADLNIGEVALERDDLPASDSGLPRSFFHFTTTQPFDQIEVNVSSTGVHQGLATDTRVHALCGNGGLS